MGLCVVGAGRELTPTSCSLTPDPALFAFSIMAFNMLLGEQCMCPVLHGADPLVTSVFLETHNLTILDIKNLSTIFVL